MLRGGSSEEHGDAKGKNIDHASEIARGSHRVKILRDRGRHASPHAGHHKAPLTRGSRDGKMGSMRHVRPILAFLALCATGALPLGCSDGTDEAGQGLSTLGGDAKGKDVSFGKLDTNTGSPDGDVLADTAAGIDVLTGDVSLPDASPGDLGSGLKDVVDAGKDAPAAPGEFGSPCTNNDQCNSGSCVESSTGSVCTMLCVTDCPAGWDCKLIKNGTGDVSNICVPRFVRLCRPCTKDVECRPGVSSTEADACLPFGPGGAEGSFCGGDCAGDGVCPDGFTCETKTLASGVPGKQCVPEGGAMCTCAPGWAALGLETACKKVNESGACPGTRGCGPGGLGACSAATPMPEICDGNDNDCDGSTDNVGKKKCTNDNQWGTCTGYVVCSEDGTTCDAAEPAEEVCNLEDDDCDGETDENLCDDSFACTDDTCTLEGCKNPVKDGFCLIEGQCVAASTPEPGDPCMRCWPKSAIGAWTPKPEDTPCDDGSDCTKADACKAGLCTGTAYTCEDNLACTSDACLGDGQCKHTVVADTCAIDGACVTAGAPNPKASCQICNPGLSQEIWSPAKAGATCDDGNACTSGDACAGGVCTGTPMDCAALDDPCNDGVCQGGQCVKSPKSGNACDDNDPCTGGDACQLGVCKGVPKDCSALNGACIIGACKSGKCTAVPNAGACDDGDPCTEGDTCAGGTCTGQPKDCGAATDACNDATCQGGQCVKKPKQGGCDDGNPCTVFDTCTNGLCIGTTKDCSNVGDVCNTGVCSQGTCVKQPKGGACNDGDVCTINDVCSNGSCQGTPKDCSALSNQCNAGVCQGGGCVTQPKSGPCNDNDSCTSGDSCSGGKCTGTPNKDAFEPNDGWVGKKIADRSDCDGALSLTGSLYPSGDVDWYWYNATDDTGCSIYPEAWLEALPAGVNYDLCVFLACKNGSSVSVKCDAGSAATDASGEKGCCSSAGGSSSEHVKVNHECTWMGTGDDGVYVDVKVYRISGTPTCSPYTLKWSAK